MRTIAAFTLALFMGGCATPDAEPPTKLPEVRPGYMPGYLQPSQLPDSLALLPAPPAAGSPGFAADEDAYRSTRRFRDTPRWALATKDAELRFPRAAEHFSCTLGIPVSEEATPHLNMLLRRIRMDASRANDRTKNHYRRLRPFMVTGDKPCSLDESSANSYPSGHASIGWAWALALAEIVPDRADAILKRGLDFGLSRVICGVHWMSDVEAGRSVGAATISRLHADPVFLSQLARAKQEIEAARTSGAKPVVDCESEARALAVAK